MSENCCFHWLRHLEFLLVTKIWLKLCQITYQIYRLKKALNCLEFHEAIQINIFINWPLKHSECLLIKTTIKVTSFWFAPNWYYHWLFLETFEIFLKHSIFLSHNKYFKYFQISLVIFWDIWNPFGHFRYLILLRAIF